jgi:ribosomal peptide maturation radical SAM protein 1
VKPPTENILLIVPPFQTIARPAIGVSQLKSNLKEQGFPAVILYLNLRFAQRIGLDLYEWIDGYTFYILLGEFIFSEVVFHHSDEKIKQYIKHILKSSEAGDHLTKQFGHKDLLQILRFLMCEALDFCKDAAEEILAYNPWMIGFTSSFQQNCSSLSIIKQVKQRKPDILTVMGGANCQTDMGEELFQQFPEIDYIGQGECDHSFVDLVKSLRNGNEPLIVPGILSRTNSHSPHAAQPLLGEDLNRQPYPDFGDYFTQVQTVAGANRIAPSLLMETSRGCWWGAKHQCTFCGFNGKELSFRSKSVSRAMNEMTALVNQYKIPFVSMVDNILDMRYFKTLLPKLADHPIVDIFYETKANLSKTQVRLLARSRIGWINPGIESLSDQALRLMRKGTTKIQNIQLLKWCAEFAIWVGWNYLYGFPGEPEDEIVEIGQDIEAIHHLQPPLHVSSIRIDRSSPYFNKSSMYGLDPIYPIEPYHYIYPFPDESLKRIAYFHQSDFFATMSKTDAFKLCKNIIANWQKVYLRSYLIAIPRKNSLIIIDTRPCAQQFLHRLVGIRRKVFELCDAAHTITQIRNALEPICDSKLQSILDSFIRFKLMIRVNEKYLSIAVNASSNCGKLTHSASGGFLKPAIQSRSIRQNLLCLLTFRIPPGQIFTGIVRRAYNTKMRVISRVVVCLTNMLYKA